MSTAALELAKLNKILTSHHLTFQELGPRSDFFLGTTAKETFNGGAGSDTVSYHKSMRGVTVNLQDSLPEIGGAAQGDRLISIENVIGSNFGDHLTGAANVTNTLVGLGGNDFIIGSGTDKLYGDSGNDTLQGLGQRGTTLMMDGGTGADHITFSANSGNANITTGAGIDVVDVFIGNRDDFTVTIKDFQPYWESFGNTVTDAEALRGDQLNLKFSSHLGSLDDVAEFTQQIRGDDLILDFHNGEINGKVVLEDIGQYLDLTTNNGYAFNIGLDLFGVPAAV